MNTTKGPSDYDRDFKVDPKNEDDRKQLLDHSCVAKALSQIIDPSHPLYKKLNNCAAGDYGAIKDKMALAKDSVFFHGSGFIGILGKRAGVAAARTAARSLPICSL